jgi:hypothetical protein
MLRALHCSQGRCPECQGDISLLATGCPGEEQEAASWTW